MGQSKPHSETVDVQGRLSRYITLSHQAGILFFSPESYPGNDRYSFFKQLRKKYEWQKIKAESSRFCATNEEQFEIFHKNNPKK